MTSMSFSRGRASPFQKPSRVRRPRCQDIKQVHYTIRYLRHALYHACAPLTAVISPSPHLFPSHDLQKMPPARARVLDDSRSETSSTIFNLKEKNSLGAGTGAGISKQKKNAGPTQNSTAKNAANTTAATAAAAVADPNSARVRSSI